MTLESGRDLFRGLLILIFAAIARWVDLTAGLVLVSFPTSPAAAGQIDAPCD